MLYFVLGIFVLIALFVISVYNSLVSLKVKIKEAWSQIDVQLKRRADLIPNLVETVKGYASHEKEVFEKVTQARTALMSASNPKEAGEADQKLGSALKDLFAVAEAYPELKAQASFGSLQNELTDTEDKVAYSRQFYNDSILDYNNKCKTFPGKVFAGIFGFKEKEYIKITEEERKPVKVKF